jgi:hypothetical protein
VPIVNLYQRLVSISGAESRVYTITQTPFQCGFIVFQVLHKIDNRHWVTGEFNGGYADLPTHEGAYEEKYIS